MAEISSVKEFTFCSSTPMATQMFNSFKMYAKTSETK